MTEAPHKIRLLTYNIRKGLGAWGRSKRAYEGLLATLGDREDDIVLIQEAFHGRAYEQSQASELGEAMGLQGVYTPNKHRRIGHHGNATLLRHEVAHARNHDISMSAMERRGALHTVVNTPGGPVHVINTHLSLTQRQRIRQLEAIASIVEEEVPPHEPLILAGDFNDWNHQLDEIVQSELGLVNALGPLQEAAPTWPAPRPFLHLDRVYLRNANVLQASTVAGRPWRHLSDHLPIAAEIALHSQTDHK